MRALTLRPHWAHAVAHLGKRVENRTRPIPEALVGQRVAIHAGAVLPKGWYRELLGATDRDMADVLALDSMPHRAIVATAVLAECVEVASEKAYCDRWCMVTPRERWMREWTDWSEPYWWRLTDVVTLDEPIPWERGQLGLWNLPDDVSARLEVG